MIKYRLKRNKLIHDFLKISCLFIPLVIFIIYIINPFKNMNQVDNSLTIAENYLSSQSGETKATPTEINGNDVEVLAIGNSAQYSAFNPFQLWHEQGITSYSAAGPKQNMCISYSILKECLTVQKPKLLILEASHFFEDRGHDILNENQSLALQYSYPLFKGTNRWSAFLNKPYIYDASFSNHMYYKGFYYRNTVKGYYSGYAYMKATKQKTNISQYAEKYLPKIIALAQKDDCQILFVSYPCVTAWTYKKHNTVSEIAKQYGIPFIDFNVETTLTDFDWMTDTRDSGNHLNYNGATKITRYMGQYLKEHYALNDFRDNQIFKEWNREYEDFMKKIS